MIGFSSLTIIRLEYCYLTNEKLNNSSFDNQLIRLTFLYLPALDDEMRIEFLSTHRIIQVTMIEKKETAVKMV